MLGLLLPPRDSLVWLIVAWLVAWRISALLVRDRGPFDLMTRLRVGLAKYGLHQLILCFHCTAVWVALLVTGLLFEWRWLTLVVALAVAGATSVTERFLGGADGSPGEETEGSDG